MKKYFAMYMQLPWEKKAIWSAAGIALIPILASWWLQAPQADASSKSASRAADMDTYIPKGFVLVPIEVLNYEALDSILGKFGVVDLYQSGGSEKVQQRLVARHVRILRAPQNPSHFAILVQESEVSEILKFGGTFTVTIRSPETGGTEIVKGQNKTRRSIVYERD